MLNELFQDISHIDQYKSVCIKYFPYVIVMQNNFFIFWCYYIKFRYLTSELSASCEFHAFEG